MKSYKWVTHKVIQETKDTITIFFNTGNADFSFLPGQYLTITCTIDGKCLSRSYSFSSAPSDRFPAITVKRVAGGKMSNYLFNNAIHVQEWDIKAPFGNFILDHHTLKDAEVAFLAGGSGMSPLFSMLKSMDNITCTPLLLYSNKAPEDTIFFHELEERQKHSKLRVFYSFSGDMPIFTQLNHVSGRFTPLAIKSILRRHLQSIETTHYFICGPTSLMDLYRDVLFSLNVPEGHIHMEYFDPVLTKPAVLETDGRPKEVLVSYYETIFRDEDPETHKCTSLIDVPAGQSLLDAFKENGIRVPSTCLNGTCGSCWATKEAGQVKMLNNFALTNTQLAEGKILLCQSYAMDQDVCIMVQ